MCIRDRHYESELTSAAPRTRTDPTTGEVIAQPGEYAYGGSLPGPVQSLDAATVAMTAAGPSWQKLKAKSNGKPYMHTIYDAFKMDANGYDTVLEEVNQNWLDATMNWSYLENTLEALDKKTKEWVAKNKNRPANDPLTKNERAYMDFMLQGQPNEKFPGKLTLSNFRNKAKNLFNIKDKEALKVKLNDVSKKLEIEMKKVGYDIHNPPEVATFRMQNTFVRFLFNEFNLRPQFNGLINRTNNNKRELMKEIRKSGPVYQYYAH